MVTIVIPVNAEPHSFMPIHEFKQFENLIPDHSSYSFKYYVQLDEYSLVYAIPTHYVGNKTDQPIGDEAIYNSYGIV